MVITVVSALLLSTGGLYYKTGDSLYRLCISNKPLDRYGCYSYIIGVSDSLNSFKQVDEQEIACVPEGVKGDELITIISSYLRDNPKKRTYGASDLVMNALRRAYPCQNTDMD